MSRVCLIVVAHRASARFPLIIAANRDEDYDRPTRAAHFWEERPEILGGRDTLHGGSWLAITRSGRVAAVTNLRGAAKPDGRSRGFLVRDFVAADVDPRAYAEEVERHAREYAGFHLIAGEIGGTFVHLAEKVREWAPGVHGVSNGPADARWEKIDRAVDHVRKMCGPDIPVWPKMTEGQTGMSGPHLLAHDLIHFLGIATSDEIERTVFVAGERYGTRSSTAIVATDDEVVFVEQSYGRGGVRAGEPVVFRFSSSSPSSLASLGRPSVP